MTTFLKPCMDHVKRLQDVPPCFHNWGGEYQVVRPLHWGMVLLRHVGTGRVGLAAEAEIIHND